MKVKYVEQVFLLLLVVAGVAYLSISLGFFENDSIEFYINPGFFPSILAAVLLVLCLVSFVQSLVRTKVHERFPLGNTFRIALILLMTVVYITIWYLFSGIYYLLTIIYFMSFSLVLSWHKHSNKKRLMAITATVAVGLTLAIYLLFDVVFAIRMT